MRDVSDEFLAAVNGSNTPVCVADVWYGSDVIRESVPVVGGTIHRDAADVVEDRLEGLKLVDTVSSGTRLRDIIHAYGCRVNIRAGFDLGDAEPELTSLGWFDITDTDALESWQWFDWRSDAVKTGEVVTVQAEGGLSVVARSGLFGPTQPVAGSDAWSAIADLCVDVVPVLDPGFSAKSLPSGTSAIVIDRDRLRAIRSIAGLWGAKPVATNEGQLTLVVPGAGPVTDSYGLFINVDAWRTRTSSADIRNGVDFAGRTSAGLEIHGYATEEFGPLAWGGPIGRRPSYAFSELMTTQAMVDEAAATELARLVSERSATQTVNALWNPAQELRDRPNLELPDRTVESEVVKLMLPLTGGPMRTTLRLPLFQGA